MTVTIDADGAIQLMDEMAERSVDMSPVLTVIASDLLTFVDTTFDASVDPAGREWEPLSEFTLKLRRAGSSKPLVDTSVLRNSLTAVAGALGIEGGTNVAYAGYHQFGTFDIPMRAFLPFNEDGTLMDEGPAEEEFDRYAEMIATFIETGEITEG